jgi:hypothetical protein
MTARGGHAHQPAMQWSADETGQAPGVVKVRLSGAAGDIEVIERSATYPNRRDPGVRVYLTAVVPALSAEHAPRREGRPTSAGVSPRPGLATGSVNGSSSARAAVQGYAPICKETSPAATKRPPLTQRTSPTPDPRSKLVSRPSKPPRTSSSPYAQMLQPPGRLP